MEFRILFLMTYSPSDSQLTNRNPISSHTRREVPAPCRYQFIVTNVTFTSRRPSNLLPKN